MTTGPAFQLFPPPQKKPERPDLSAAVQAALAKNPKRTVKSPVLNAGQLAEVVVVVRPETKPTQHTRVRQEQPKTTIQSKGTEQLKTTVHLSEIKDVTEQPSLLPPAPPLAPAPAPAQAQAPAPADNVTLRSETPALTRSNTNATSRTAGPIPVMRSMFPQYDPTVPLHHQQYVPMQASPPSIPREKISKAPYSPEFTPPQGLYIPHANLRDQQAQRVPESGSTTPSHTPLEQLELAWEVTNGCQTTAQPMSITLPMHRSVSSPNPSRSPRDRTPKTRISFGPSKEEAFYSLSQSSAHTFLQEADASASPRDQEMLLQRHHPSQATSVPAVDFTIRPPPARQESPRPDMPDLHSIPHLITTIYPKLAAMFAIEAAANSPAAAELARIDPTASSPAAAQLAQDAVAQAASRECCALFWVPSSPEDPSSQGSYELHHPTLGTFPIAVNGSVSKTFGSAFDVNSSRPSTSERRNFSRPNPGGSIKSPSQSATITILDPRAQGTNVSSSVLGRLDLSTNTSPLCNALTLDLPAIVRNGNPFLADAVAAAILAVAVAEVERGGSSTDSIIDGLSGDLAMLMGTAAMFPAPPKSSLASDRKIKSKHSSRSSSSSDIGKWKNKFNKKSKQAVEVAEIQGRSAIDDLRGDDGSLGLVPRAIVGTIRLTFKASVFIISVGVKIIGGAVRVVIKRIDRVE